MKEDLQALSDNSIKIAINYDSKEIAANKLGEHSEAEHHWLMARYHRNESKKYLQDMKDYE